MPAIRAAVGWIGAAALAASACGARADAHSLQGNFGVDDDLAVFTFVLAASGDMAATSFSYAGGTNGAAQVVPAGGFAPVLSLFDAGGDLVVLDVGSAHTCGNPASGFCWDAGFSYRAAPAGAYTLVLSQDGNTPQGQLVDGFLMAGQPHYTADYLGGADWSATFVQVDGSQRTGHWAFDLSVPAGVAVVPEPASAGLLAAGLALLGAWRRRARATSSVHFRSL